MTTLQKTLIGAGAVIVLGAIVTASILHKESKKGEEVYMAKAAKKDLISSVSATGRIEPRTKVNVQSSVIGEIVKLPVKEGDVVHKGDLLVQIDPERYRSEVDRLQANLRIAHIEVERQEVSLKNSRKNLERNRDLFAQGFLPPDALERSELEVRTGEIGLESLREQIAQASAALDKAKDELSKTTLRSPMDGLVTQLSAKQGEMTLTGTMNNPGTVIMVVSDMGEVLAEVDVDETRIVQVETGHTARVVVDAVGETHPYPGKVSELGGSAVQRAGQQVQVFPVKIALDKADPKLRPGMTAKARIETKRADEAITVPIQAVLLRPASEIEKALATRKGGEKKGPEKPPVPSGAAADGTPATKGKASRENREAVFMVVGGKALLTPVRTGISDEADTVILEGLKEGDTVVTGPYRSVKSLKDGDAVKEKKGEEPKEEKKEESGSVSVEVD